MTFDEAEPQRNARLSVANTAKRKDGGRLKQMLWALVSGMWLLLAVLPQWRLFAILDRQELKKQGQAGSQSLGGGMCSDKATRP